MIIKYMHCLRCVLNNYLALNPVRTAGMNDAVVKGLSAKAGERFAYDA